MASPPSASALLPVGRSRESLLFTQTLRRSIVASSTSALTLTRSGPGGARMPWIAAMVDVMCAVMLAVDRLGDPPLAGRALLALLAAFPGVWPV